MKTIKTIITILAVIISASADAQTYAQVTAWKKQAVKGSIPACANLAEYYRKNWMLDDAETYYTKEIILYNKKKQSASAMDVAKLRDKVRKLRDFLPNTSKVQFIDSMVVDKQRFLDEIKIDKESGTLDSYSHFFNVNDTTGAMIYLNGLGTKLTYSFRDAAGKMQLFGCDKKGKGWTESHMFSGLQENSNLNYPFVNSEGTKIYYACDSRDGLGGYDIYVTRENEDGGYAEPTNIGLPYNSEFNDYLYVEDDVNQLGWLVSDRYQPEDKVCIYVFIPEDLRTSYDYNDPTERKQCRKVALLPCIKDTWSDKNAVSDALKRLEMAQNKSDEEASKAPEKEFTFVVDDDHVYYYTQDFKSPSAYTSLQTWLQRKKQLQEMNIQLDQQRLAYAKATPAERQKMSNQLYRLEEQTFQMEDNIKQIEKNLRKEELSALGLLRY